jgi:Matrixin
VKISYKMIIVKKLVLTAIWGAVILSLSSTIFAFTVKITEDGRMLNWPASRVAIFYRVGNSDAGSRKDTIEAVDRAFMKWEENSRGELAFIYSGEDKEEGASRDGINSLIWVYEGWRYGNRIAAVSTIWPSDDGETIDEVDIEFNGRDYDWSSSDSPGIGETALHEIGHLLGIGHSFNPGAVMHAVAGPTDPVRQALSQDDIEALVFLYPSRPRELNRYDLPVLFYPRDFPDDPSDLTPATGPDPRPGYWVNTMGGVDFDGDGFRSELLAGCRNEDGVKTLAAWEITDDGNDSYRRIDDPRTIQLPGVITAVSGIDIDRDGNGSEAAVLLRQEGREKLFFYDLNSTASKEPSGSMAIASPPADNLIGMAGLDADDDQLRDELLILRAVGNNFALYLHDIPLPGEDIHNPDPGIEISIPGLQENSILLGLAVLDADGDGVERDPVFLELTEAGEYWLHSFRLTLPGEEFGHQIEYLTSAQLEEAISGVLPARMTGVDLNRDGFFNELIIFSSKK